MTWKKNVKQTFLDKQSLHLSSLCFSLVLKWLIGVIYHNFHSPLQMLSLHLVMLNLFLTSPSSSFSCCLHSLVLSYLKALINFLRRKLPPFEEKGRRWNLAFWRPLLLPQKPTQAPTSVHAHLCRRTSNTVPVVTEGKNTNWGVGSRNMWDNYPV